MPHGIIFKNLTKDIHKQTERIKKKKLYLRNIIEMQMALILISFLFRRRRKKFYSKYYPLWGGITNINLNTIWKHADDKLPIDYFRAVSTGYATPLVMSFTTVNNILNIGISYRKTVFKEKDIEEIKKNLYDTVSALQKE
jgi:hypothetical protein